MWIVRLAMRKPYTFAVASVLILLFGIASILSMPIDVFPAINLPVITVLWQYGGITPDDMAKRMVTASERAYTTSVSGIEHMESQSVSGIGVVKIYLQPDADVRQGIAQVAATSQTILRAMPPGTQPPYILRYDASDVPVVQIAITSSTMTEQQIFDYSTNFVRTQLATVQGAQIPAPYGGKSRVINVDIDPQELYAKGLSPNDVSAAISAQNLVLPSGDAKIGARDYTVGVNSSPSVVDQLNDLPIKDVNGAIVTVGDVAHVRDGYNPQTNIVNINGRRSVMLSILKSQGASTLDVVRRVREALPRIESTLPRALHIELIGDQSIFVGASVTNVVREAIIAACLTATMILLFLGSLRSTLIVAVSIPLSILTSIVVLGALGETLNTSTLGGLALAVGILVDDTTVTIENIFRNLALGKPLRRAILDGSQEIVTPALVSTLSICIVFVPMGLLSGVSRYLFLPMGEAVVFAMLASYLLSRTVTPTFTALLLPREAALFREEGQHGYAPAVDVALQELLPHHSGHVLSGNGRSGDISLRGSESAADKQRRGIVWRTHSAFNDRFERMRDAYEGAISWALRHRSPVIGVFLAFCALSFCLYPFVGRDFFPQVDAGQLRLHVRVPASTRIEETARVFARISDRIRSVIPADETNTVVENIGLPIFVNLAYGDNATVGSGDGEILVTLKPGHHPTEQYVEQLRRVLPKAFPDETFFFQPADIVNQILNFGQPAPIDVQVGGPITNQAQNLVVARDLQRRIATIPGAADVHLQQIVDGPSLLVDVDRMKAQQVGLTQINVASSLLVSLAGSGQAAPSYYLNPRNGVVYTVTIQTPQYRMNTPDALLSTPITAPGNSNPELLSNIATVSHTTTPLVINHYNIQPVYDIYVNTQMRDLGGVSGDIQRVVDAATKNLPRGSTITVRGQVQSMNTSFTGLSIGIVGALVLVYLLLVINFQSWIDPLVVVSGAPGVFSGILWMLYATQTTLSVPSLTGTIMAVGVSTANSILLVTFANERRLEGMNAIDAVVSAGFTRLRPVLMTALAMVLGMLPMALALGEGGEQEAPLGRAVIGGLLVATVCTLFIVPISYSILRATQPKPLESDDEALTRPRPAKRRRRELVLAPGIGPPE
ncbi:MAG: efflux RND transporter permease subunit [Capsulimonadaceae bacterium]